jgi:hypothetical protein
MLKIISLIFLQEIFYGGKSINKVTDYIWIQEIYIACNLSDHLNSSADKKAHVSRTLGQNNKPRVMKRGLEEGQPSN